MTTIKQQIRQGTPQVGVVPYRQIHAHSTGNPNSTAQNEADYMGRKDLNSGFYTHVVGNGQIIQVAPINRGAWDVGGGWNAETYAAVELIESHKTKEEFTNDYKLYVNLLRDLATQGGIPKTLDSMDLAGIKTHEHCRKYQPNNGTTHTDPYGYLAKWGISKEQFAKDLANGVGGTVTPPPTTPSGAKYKVGQAVTLLSRATHYQTGQSIAQWAKNKAYTVSQVKAVNQSNSKWAYLLSGINSWVLEQDLSTGGTVEPPKPTTPSKPLKDSGTIQFTGSGINVRRAPSINGQAVATYDAGQRLTYDSLVYSESRWWVSYIGSGSGQRNYVAVGNNGKLEWMKQV